MGQIRRKKNKCRSIFLVSAGCIVIVIFFYLYRRLPYDKVKGYFQNQLNYTCQDISAMYERRKMYLAEELIESTAEDRAQQERLQYLIEHGAECTLEMLTLGEMNAEMQIPFEVWYKIQYKDDEIEAEEVHWMGKVTLKRSWGFLCRISKMETTHTCLQTGEYEKDSESCYEKGS